jgi:hypothetical protein
MGSADEARIEVLRRVGLTAREARRVAAGERLKAETRRWGQASIIGLFFWAVWKLLHHGFRPAWLAGSLAVAATFFALSVQERGVDAVLASDPPDLEARLAAAFLELTPEGEDPRALMIARMTEALDVPPGQIADIERFHAWAAAAPLLIGERRLALEGLAGAQTSRALQRAEAELVALPAWRREQLLAQGLERRLDAMRVSGDEPGLAYADDLLRRRYERARTAFDIYSQAAEAFLRGRADGRMQIGRLPGPNSATRGAVLYDDARALIAGVCARARPDCPASLREAAGNDADVMLAALGAASRGEPAAVLIRAAKARGLADTGWIARLAGTGEAAALSQSAIAEFGQIDIAFAAPQSAQAAIDRLTAPLLAEENARRAALDDILAVRDATSAAMAVRLVGVLREEGDSARLRLIAEATGPRALVLAEMRGPDMLALADDPPLPPRPRVTHFYYGVAAGLFSALAALLAALRDMARRPLMRAARRTRYMDARLTRLFLGKKT